MNPAGSNNQTDQTANFFWLLMIITGFLLIFWWFEKRTIVTVIFHIRHYEMMGIQTIVDGINWLANQLSLPTFKLQAVDYWQHFIATAHSGEVAFSDVGAMSDTVGLWMRYPVAIILMGLAVWMFFYHSTSQFHRRYTMQTLKKFESQNWPQIAPVLSEDLLKTNLDEGPWAMAKLPIDFCKENGLLAFTESPSGKKLWALQTGAAERLFVLQMGPLWQGPTKLPVHIKALLVMFVARAHRDHKITEQLIAQISRSAETGKLDFTGVDDLVEKYRDSKVIKWLAKRHAYVGSFMASLLEIARVEGVLATAEFLWLKPVDRRLWYLLNSVGRQASVVEVAGLFAHWLAEKRLKRALRSPMVREAVVALEADIRDILYISEEDRWHTSSVA